MPQNVIQVQRSVNDEWLVTINANSRTEHVVHLSKADLDQVGYGHSAEEVLRESFRFLLEREPNTSILSSFSLPMIGRYFPEYQQEMRRRLSGSK